LIVHYGHDETTTADLVVVAVGRRPVVEGFGLDAAGVDFDIRRGILCDDHRRTSVDHLYAVGDCAGYWQLAHTAFREGTVAAENVCGGDAIVDGIAVPRPIFSDPEIASVGLTEAQARETYGSEIAVGKYPWGANARAVMQNDRVGWVKSIRESRTGTLVGLVMIGPHVTDMVEAGVVAIDARATVDAIADGMAPHPTLSETIKGAALAAVGRSIDIPNRQPVTTGE
jgi:dihydrolipoamide dehydrogenase